MLGSCSASASVGRVRSSAWTGRRCATRPGVVMMATCGRGYGRSRLSAVGRSEEHTSELQSLMRISYAVFCLKKKNKKKIQLILSNSTHLKRTNQTVYILQLNTA